MIETDITTEVAELHFSAGLPGFPRARHFLLAAWGSPDSPFFLMSSVDDPDLGFVVVSPWLFYPDYEFDLDDATAARLGIQDPSDLVVLCVVTLQDSPEEATVNLLGPIVVNRHSREAVQAVLSTTAYDVRAPLARAG